ERIDDWQYQPATGDAQVLQEVRFLRYIPANAVFSFATGQPYHTILSSGAPLPAVAGSFMFIQGLQSDAIMMQASSTQAGGIHALRSGGAGGGPLGYAAGGAKDINNFRDNVKNDYLPIPTDITYEGIFYNYYFRQGQEQECRELFCPSYSRAVSKDPLGNETEHFLTVGLNSNLRKSEFERKKLNLVLVLDISGSMSTSFDQYYYDRFGNRHRNTEATGKSKMQVAAESLVALTRHLEKDDRLGVVLFNDQAYKAKPIRLTQDTDMEAIRQHMLELRAGGGTNMASGMRMASQMLEPYEDVNKSRYENRIIFLTDAMPNIGTRTESGLIHMMEENAEDGIYTTFVGIGVDFNTKLVDAITSVRGANYFSVHSSEQFRKRMDTNFKYMVTPLVFNLTLRLESDAYRIEKVYGSTAAEEATGEIMKVNTLFPAPTKQGRTKGGVVLVQLERTGQGTRMNLRVTYEKRSGGKGSSSRHIRFGQHQPPYYENTGIHKAVLLSRYVNLMKNWVVYERSQDDSSVDHPPIPGEA
ncbi:MAG: VWA domain-containing protein, partial [Candidatus Nanohaloarchaea archaeon]|nr:VWA domain-containing protein [Candidatus Nanohaloarchaea archaeon]